MSVTEHPPSEKHVGRTMRRKENLVFPFGAHACVVDVDVDAETGTFVNYALPTAAELPSFETDRTVNRGTSPEGGARS